MVGLNMWLTGFSELLNSRSMHVWECLSEALLMVVKDFVKTVDIIAIIFISNGVSSGKP